MSHDVLCPWPGQACACPLIAQVRADEQLTAELRALLAGR